MKKSLVMNYHSHVLPLVRKSRFISVDLHVPAGGYGLSKVAGREPKIMMQMQISVYNSEPRVQLRKK